MSTTTSSLTMSNMGNNFSGGNSPFYTAPSDEESGNFDSDFFKQDTKSVNIYSDPIFAIWGEIDNRSLKDAAKLFMNENIIKPTKKVLKTFDQVKRGQPKRKHDMVF